MADVVIVSGGGGGALEGGGPVLVAGFEGASEFSTGDSGVGRSMGQLGPGVRGKAGDPVAIAPGIEVPIGDPYQSYPAGREQAGMINLASLTAAGSRGAEVRVPEWASSYSGYIFGHMGTAVVQVREGPLNYGVREPFSDDVTISAGTSGAGGASRFHPCTPGTVLIGVTTTADAAADSAAVLVFVFSPAAA